MSRRTIGSHRRLRSLPRALVLGRDVAVARSRRARLLGLARIEAGETGAGLLIENCRSVHTFGMRFPLDLVFLDARLRPLALHRRVPLRRFRTSRAARHVVEFPSPREDAARRRHI